MASTAPPRPATTSAAPGRGRLPAPVRDRRPALAALALLLILGGALTSALLAYRSGERVDVLVAARDISVGDEISRADFATARVAADGAAVVEAAAVGNFVGTRATTDVPAGTLVNRTMFLTGSLIPDGAAVLGVVLAPTQRPAEPIQAGDVVRVYRVPSDSSTGGVGNELARAVRVERAVDTGGGGLSLSLLVPPDLAPAIVAAASSNSVAVARLAPSTTPLVDFARE